MAPVSTSPPSGATWKAGGTPAEDYPPINADHKKFVYHRLKEDQTVEKVDAFLHKSSANVAHPFDEGVTVEDLSDIDIVQDQFVEDFRQMLPRFLRENPEAYADPDSIKVQNIDGVDVVRFKWRGMKVECRTLPLDAMSKNSDLYSAYPTGRRLAQEQRRTSDIYLPPLREVQAIMAKILVLEEGNMRGGKDRQWVVLARRAHGMLHRLYRSTTQVDDSQSDSQEDTGKQYSTYLKLVQVNYKEDVENKCYRLLVDRAIAEDCDRIKGQDIVLVRDRYMQLVVSVLRPTKILIPESTLQKMHRVVLCFTWKFPYSRSDELRHPTENDDHFMRDPDKNVRVSKEPNNAISATEHTGIHHEIGKSATGDLFLQEYTSKRKSTIDSKIRETELPKIIHGIGGFVEKVLRFTLEQLDPGLYTEMKDIKAVLPPTHRPVFAKTGDSVYGYMAQLVNAQTECHTDSSDMVNGLPGIMCFGEFTGGDLVLKQLGLRIDFPPGSHCHLRGHELKHFIMPFEGTRHCVVLTGKETVRKCASEIRKEMTRLRTEADLTKQKEESTWSAEEKTLVEATSSIDTLSTFIYEADKAKNTAARPVKKAANEGELIAAGTKRNGPDDKTYDHESDVRNSNKPTKKTKHGQDIKSFFQRT